MMFSVSSFQMSGAVALGHFGRVPFRSYNDIVMCKTNSSGNPIACLMKTNVIAIYCSKEHAKLNPNPTLTLTVSNSLCHVGATYSIDWNAYSE